MGIAERVHIIQQKINDPSVTLIAVTKYATLAQMESAYEAGIRHMGESKIQDALDKFEAFSPKMLHDIHWHFIGHLQTNKVNKIIGKFALIHSVDSLKLAEKLSLANEKAGLTQNILLQINISGETSKYGFTPEAIDQVIPKLLCLPSLNIQGLMTMAPHTQDVVLLKTLFSSMVTLRNQLRRSHNVDLPQLSMGMSNDYMHAIKCGATMVRIGSDLFQTNKG